VAAIVAAGLAAGITVAGTHRVGPRAAGALCRTDTTSPVAVAALDATVVARWLDADPTGRAAIVGALATPAFAPVLTGRLVTQLAPLVGRLGATDARAQLRQAVLGAHLVTLGSERAQVAVWMMTSLDPISTSAPPLAAFSTETLTLVRHGARWLLDQVGSSDGPTPQVTGTPTPAASFAAALVGFADWRPA
jgi:hypothetical protein